jgi:hypothetical protein
MMLPVFRRFRRAAWSLLPLLALALPAVPPVLAQQQGKPAAPFTYDSRRHARASNSAITVGVERGSGRFWVETGDGTPLLFCRGEGLTSFTNLRFQGTTFTNNTLVSPRIPALTSPMPSGTVTEAADRVVFTVTLAVQGCSLECTQEFAPMLENDYAFIRVTTRLRNIAPTAVRAGLQQMYDLFLGASDLANVSVAGAPVLRETGWDAPSVPGEWTATAPGTALRARGRLAGAGLTPPDRFIIGRWQYNGYLGAAYWDYAASGFEMWDNAVLMQWNERVLAPGASAVTVTDYGYETSYRYELSCRADTVAMNATQTDYIPNPLRVYAAVRNTGLVSIPRIAARIALPAGTSFAGQDSALAVGGSLAPGASTLLSWSVLAQFQDSGALLRFPITLEDPADPPLACEAQTALPRKTVETARLGCPFAVTLAIDSGAWEYTPNPFTVTARVFATGNVPLVRAQAQLAPWSGLTVVGADVQQVTPDTVYPGSSGTATWTLMADRSPAAAVLHYTISVFGATGKLDACQGDVHVPALNRRCIPVGVATSGTDFWTAFPLNDGSGITALQLYVAAAEDSRVRVIETRSGAAADYTVPAGTVRTITLDSRNDADTAEVIQHLGVHLTSDRPVALYSASLCSRHSDAAIVLPTHALGRSYATTGYNFDNTFEHVLVVATEDGTTVTVDPFSMTSKGRPERIPFSVSLNAGDTYYLRPLMTGAFGGLSGTLITSDKPVAVISGAASGWIPTTSRSDYGYLNPHYDQMIPEELLGTEYIAVPFRARLGGDTWKAVAFADTTLLTIGADAPVTLLRGKPYEFALDRAVRISATHPFLLAQFANSAAWDTVTLAGEYGDASMVIHAPTDRYAHCFSIPSPSSPTAFALQQADAFVNIVVPAGAERTILINGTAPPDTAFRAVPGAAFSYLQMPLPPGLSSVACADPRGIGAVAYGFEYHDAYSFNAGFRTERHSHVTGTEQTAAADFALGAPYPNPASRDVLVPYRLPRAGAAELLLVDALGRTRRTAAAGILPEGGGSSVIRLDGLPAGLYTVVLRHGGRTLSHTLMVIP